MPLHVVRKDLAEGRLSVLPFEDVPPDGLILTMSVVWQTKSPRGPPADGLVDRLKQIAVDAGKVPKPPIGLKPVAGKVDEAVGEELMGPCVTISRLAKRRLYRCRLPHAADTRLKRRDKARACRACRHGYEIVGLALQASGLLFRQKT